MSRRQWLVASTGALGLLSLRQERAVRAEASASAAPPSRIENSASDGVWRPTHVDDAPQRRTEHTAVWTGREMLVWGGHDERTLNDGALYDPLRDRWRSISDEGAPSARAGHAAVWTGHEMLVWGGHNQWSPGSNGGVYTPPS